jgi:hypothetical protein
MRLPEEVEEEPRLLEEEENQPPAQDSPREPQEPLAVAADSTDSTWRRSSGTLRRQHMGLGRRNTEHIALHSQ